MKKLINNCGRKTHFICEEVCAPEDLTLDCIPCCCPDSVCGCPCDGDGALVPSETHKYNPNEVYIHNICVDIIDDKTSSRDDMLVAAKLILENFND